METHKTAIGGLPNSKDIDTNDLDISPEVLKELLSVENSEWRDEINSIGEYLESYGDRLPAALKKEFTKLKMALS